MKLSRTEWTRSERSLRLDPLTIDAHDPGSDKPAEVLRPLPIDAEAAVAARDDGCVRIGLLRGETTVPVRPVRKPNPRRRT